MSYVQPVNTAECLEKLYESNFNKLFSLIPDLCSFQIHAIAVKKNKPTLYLKVLERSRHTLTIELTHQFDTDFKKFFLPAVTIRIYLDAKLVEVLNDHARNHVSRVYKDPGRSVEIRNYKWRLNYFLQKWLDHCLDMQYSFSNKPLVAEIK